MTTLMQKCSLLHVLNVHEILVSDIVRQIWNEIRYDKLRLNNRGVDPYGTGGHVPPIFGLGGDIITNVPPQYF